MIGRSQYLGYYLDMDIYERERTVSWLLPGYLWEGEACILIITWINIRWRGLYLGYYLDIYERERPSCNCIISWIWIYIRGRCLYHGYYLDMDM